MSKRDNSKSSLDQQLRYAIANKRLLQIYYEGAQRVIEPHDYGVKKGVVSLLAYQLQSSDPSKTSGWRLLHLSKISECVVLEQTFKGSRGEESQQHHNWDVLYLRVD